MTQSSSIAKSIYERVLSDHVELFMMACGFRKTKGHWFVEWREDCFRRVSLGFRTVSGRDEGWIEVWVGVGFRSLDQLLSKCPGIDSFDPDRPCAIATLTERLRSGPPYQTVQWRILPDVDPQVVGPEVIKEIKEWALPFLDSHGSVEQAIAAWESGQYYGARAERDEYLAAAYWLKGQRERAIQVIKGALELREPPLRERAERRGRCYEEEREDDPDIARYEKVLKFFVSQAGVSAEKEKWSGVD